MNVYKSQEVEVEKYNLLHYFFPQVWGKYDNGSK